MINHRFQVLLKVQNSAIFIFNRKLPVNATQIVVFFVFFQSRKNKVEELQTGPLHMQCIKGKFCLRISSWLHSSVRPKFGIGYSIGRKYRSIWVWVSVSDLNQNNGFGRTLVHSMLFSFDGKKLAKICSKKSFRNYVEQIF